MSPPIPNSSRLSKAAAASMILSIATASAAAHPAFVPSFRSCSKHATTPRATPKAPMRQIDSPARPRNVLHMAVATAYPDLKEEISAMRIKDIREELESYGVSTTSIFEKGELVEALIKARNEEKIPVNIGDIGEDTWAERDRSSSSSDHVDVEEDSSKKNGWFRNMVDQFTGGASGGGNGSTRKERIEQEREKCKRLKVKELKEELESYGMSTKSYFEKSEFERAVAEARVDGAKKKSASSRGAPGGASSSTKTEEKWDPSYRDVTARKFDARMLDGIVIDVRSR